MAFAAGSSTHREQPALYAWQASDATVTITTFDVPNDGRYEWDINPSTRPLVALDKGRPPTGDPSPTQTFTGGPGPSALPCADFDTDDETCWNDHAFTVPTGPGIDNAEVQIAINWPTPGSDWDMKLFVDSNNDGSSVGETQQIGSSGRGQTTSEATSIVEPTLAPGTWRRAESGTEMYETAPSRSTTDACAAPSASASERGLHGALDTSGCPLRSAASIFNVASVVKNRLGHATGSGAPVLTALIKIASSCANPLSCLSSRTTLRLPSR